MRKAFKNTATILLLLLLTAPFFYSVTMEWKKNLVQQEMKKRLMEEKLTSIILDQNKVNWFEEGKEILVGDHLFDVKSTTLLPGNKIRFTGLYDTQETVMRNQLKKFQQEQNKKDSRQLGQFFTDWKALPFSAEEDEFIIEGKPLHCMHPEMDPVSVSIAILKPPVLA